MDLNLELDFDEMEKLILEKMKSENIQNKIDKMLISIQKNNKRNLFIATLFLSKLGLLQIRIDIKNKKILDFEKKSLFDIIKFSRKKR